MKSRSFLLKSSAIIILFTCLVVTAMAQTEKDHSAQARSQQLTDKMKKELGLTDEQTPKVQEINLKYAQKNEETAKENSGRRVKFDALKADNEAKTKELKAILTEEQYKKYQKMQKEMKAEMKEAYKSRKGR